MSTPIAQIAQAIRPHIHQTPILQSRLINALAQSTLFFKCENFQRMGAFKMRGAIAAIQALPKELQHKGVVTHSSGNFAQALSLAAQTLAIPAYIVMPENAPAVKQAAVHAYGGKITRCAPTLAARESTAQRLVQNTGATFIHPSNDLPVILGQGTAAYELLQAQPDLETLIVPVGGGGLLAGTALAAAEHAQTCTVFGAEPFRVDDAYRALKSGHLETNTRTDTIADGLRTQLGDKNFPIIQKHVQEILRVDENEIIEALCLIWERMKIVVEPSSAVALAAVLRYPKCFEGKRVGIILSGGNVDLSDLPF